ncbi:hypothetical protein [Fructilactobacillus carniphilus]|uniref:ApeA N-terminal domain-containing protein n=1 Tax=Fructilactobacillus carniphilus TaxID=2940297 RepID=A0ABY5BX96_9LACO|nr:hypothetical protein [Fructilactobacillus carniphilus]USS91117.1 hypothetical protein M3M37_02605 [Fructilactobacillus carniphilus]
MEDLTVPISIECPICTSSIVGQFKYNQLILTNVENVDDKLEGYYCLEVSAIFPTAKIKKITSKIDPLYIATPFLRNADIISSGFNLNKSINFMTFINNNKWSQLLNWFHILNNNKQYYIYNEVSDYLKTSKSVVSKVTDKLELNIALHQILLTDTGISSFMDENTLKNYTDVAEKMLSIKDVIVNYIENNKNDIKNKLSRFDNEFLNIIDEFSKRYIQFIPLINLKKGNTLNNLDKEKYGITTINYNQLNHLYAHTYEFIKANIEVIFILNNLFSRSDANKFPDKKSKEYFDKLIFENKLDFLVNTEPFSKQIKKSMRNRIRNSISHFDISVNSSEQLITYTDNHAKKIKKEIIYYIDLANLCLENIYFILYINELYYNLKKYLFLVDGYELNESNYESI